MIEVSHLYKSFGAVEAVIDVSFQAADGQITGLLGPNGAGKSTTMRMISGALEPDRGEVRVAGFDSGRRLAIQSRLGVLADARGLYHRLTARENIRYFGRLRGMGGGRLETRIETLSKLLDMGEFIDRRTEGFSTGQQVKVAIARALVHEPDHIMLDEPTNGLDVMSTRAMREAIMRLRDEGVCLLLSSHIMQEIALLCQEIVIIAHGRIAAHGTADELRRLTGTKDLEEAFVSVIGSKEGLLSGREVLNG